MDPDSAEERIAYLEARVRALEDQLARRSTELRLIQDYVCADDLALIARVAAGFDPRRRSEFDPGGWHETTELRRAEVADVLRDLWRTVGSAPPYQSRRDDA